ncbi:MAG: nucleotide-binding protein [Rhodospirillaceae bacterium]|nr:nucleotide-binding protein [Rhodospirillaceae bacterium]
MERIQRISDEIPELTTLKYDTPKFVKWHRNAEIAITNTFGSKSRHLEDFGRISYTPNQISFDNQDYYFNAAYLRGLKVAASVLESMIDEIEEYWEEKSQPENTKDSKSTSPKNTKKIFVIHGHDEAALESVARFLTTLKLVPVILHEQPNKGRTIIEKFEKHANVGFAVVLLTPDDVGALAENRNELKPRARQNVILELGFFLGQLGRELVCPLVKGDVETPSDYDGVVYTKLDEAGGWKIQLLQELKAAGFEIDANLAVGP